MTDGPDTTLYTCWDVSFFFSLDSDLLGRSDAYFLPVYHALAYGKYITLRAIGFWYKILQVFVFYFIAANLMDFLEMKDWLKLDVLLTCMR